MAIFHLHIKSLGKSNNSNIVAASAYRAGIKMSEQKNSDDLSDTKIHNYSRKEGVVFSKVFTPENASVWMGDRETLWNLIQNKFDVRKNAVFAQEVVVALPVELDFNLNQELLEDYVQNVLVGEGIICDVNIHMENPSNPHAHILMTTREIVPDDKGDFTFGKKVRYWDSRGFLMYLRKHWAIYTNKHLEINGLDVRVSHLSNRERNLDLKPTLKEGTGSKAYIDSRRVMNENIRNENKQKIISDPIILIDLVSNSRTLFTRQDIENELAKYFKGDEIFSKEYIASLESILNSSRLIYSGIRSAYGMMFYKDSSRYNLEMRFEKLIEEMKAEFSHHNLGLSSSKIKSIIGNKNIKSNITSKQFDIVKSIINSGDIVVLEGLAGSGKTSILREVVKIYREYNKKIIATSVSNTATMELGRAIESRSINLTKLRYDITEKSNQDFVLNLSSDYYKSQVKITKTKILNDQTILIIDEATMVNLPDMHYFLNLVRDNQAKIILVGDRRQLPAVNISGGFDRICKVFEPLIMNVPKRQIQNLHRKATRLLSDYKITEAIKIYVENNNFVFCGDEHIALEKLSKDLSKSILKNLDKKSSIGLAYRNLDVELINNLVRKELKQSGHIGHKEAIFDFRLNDLVSKKNFSINDRVIFYKNDKKLGVFNKDQGKVISLFRSKMLQISIIRIKLDRVLNIGKLSLPIIITMHNKEYDGLDHAYAINISKSQGLTFENSFCYVDYHNKYSSFIVAATRHRENVNFYVSDQYLQSVIFDQNISTSFKDKEQMQNKRIDGLVSTISRKDSRIFASELISKNMKEQNADICEYVALVSESRKIVSSLSNYTKSDYKTQLRQDLAETIKMRNKMAEKIINQYNKYSDLASLNHINYHLLQKHAGKLNCHLEYKNTNQDSRFFDDNLKEIICEISDLGKYQPNSLMTYSNKANLERSIKNIVSKMDRLLNDENDRIIAISELISNKDDIQIGINESEKRLADAKHNNSTIMYHLLENTFFEKPGQIIENWNSMVSSSKLDLDYASLTRTIISKYSLRGIGLGKFWSLNKERSISIENLTILEKAFKIYEENKDIILNPPSMQYNKLQKEKIYELNMDIQSLQKRMLHPETKVFLKDLSEFINSRKDKLDILKWISKQINRDRIESIRDQIQEKKFYKNRQYNAVINIDQKYNFSTYEIEKIFCDNVRSINPDAKVTIRNNIISAGSIKMNLDNGLWYRFSSGEGGSIYQFLKLTNNDVSKFYATIKQNKIQNYSNLKPNHISRAFEEKLQVISPIPSFAPKFNPQRDIGYILRDSKLTAIYPYKNIQNQLIGYSVRIESSDGKKVLPIALTHKNQKYLWQVKGFQDEAGAKPIFGLEKCSDMRKPILIVEGEKTAISAQKIFPNYSVISWLGGSANANKVNWDILKDREVYIWPDNDDVGIQAGKNILVKLNHANQKIDRVYLLNPKCFYIQEKPYENILPDKWDLADDLPEKFKHLSKETIISELKTNYHELNNIIYSKERSKRIGLINRLSGINLAKEDITKDTRNEEKIYQVLSSKDLAEYIKFRGQKGEYENTHDYLDLSNEFFKELLIQASKNNDLGKEDNLEKLNLMERLYNEKISNFTHHIDVSKDFEKQIYGSNLIAQEKRILYSQIVRDIIFLYSKQSSFDLIKPVKFKIAEKIFDIFKQYKFNDRVIYQSDKKRISEQIFSATYNSEFAKTLFSDTLNKHNNSKNFGDELSKHQSKITGKSIELDK